MASVLAPRSRARILAQSGAAQPAHTGTIAELAVATVTLPPLGPNSIIRLRLDASFTPNANTKTVRVRLGGLSGAILCAVPYSTSPYAGLECLVRNRNSPASQRVQATATRATDTVIAGQATTSAVNTALSQTLVITVQLANAADSFVLESYDVTLVT